MNEHEEAIKEHEEAVRDHEEHVKSHNEIRNANKEVFLYNLKLVEFVCPQAADLYSRGFEAKGEEKTKLYEEFKKIYIAHKIKFLLKATPEQITEFFKLGGKREPKWEGDLN